MNFSSESGGGEGGAGCRAVCNPCPVEEGLGLERSYGQVKDLFAMGASETQVLRTNTAQVWDESLSPYVYIASRGSRRKALLPEIQNGHEWLHGQQSTVRGQAGGLESRDCSFTQSRLHQYPAEAFQGMPEPRQWANITEC